MFFWVSHVLWSIWCSCWRSSTSCIRIWSVLWRRRTKFILLFLLIWWCWSQKARIISWLVLRMTFSFVLFIFIFFRVCFRRVSFRSAAVSIIHGVSSLLSFLLLKRISTFKIFLFSYLCFEGVVFKFLLYFWRVAIIFTHFGGFGFWGFWGIIKLAYFRSVLSRLSLSSIMGRWSISFSRWRSWFSFWTIFLVGDLRFSSWLMLTCVLLGLRFLLVKNKSRISDSFYCLFIVKSVVDYHFRNVVSYVLNES